MTACSMCGNEYEHAFRVRTHDGRDLTFDSIECAAHMIAPRCSHCDCQILGHGIEAADATFCCAHCARESGEQAARDNVAHHAMS